MRDLHIANIKLAALSHLVFNCQQLSDWQWESFLCHAPSLSLARVHLFPCVQIGFFHSHIGLNLIKKNKTMKLREKITRPHFYELETWILQAFSTYMCEPDTYPSKSFRVFSGRDEPSVSQWTGWGNYCGRLSFRKGKYKWFVTLNFKHARGIQFGTESKEEIIHPASILVAGRLIEFPS